MSNFTVCGSKVAIKCILLLSGVPGAGKSHFAHEFKTRVASDVYISTVKVLSFDEFEVSQDNWTRGGNGPENSYQTGKARAWSALRSELMVFNTSASRGVGLCVEVVVVDDTMHLKSMRKNIQHLIDELNSYDVSASVEPGTEQWLRRPYCMLVSVGLTAPLTSALERNATRSIGTNTMGCRLPGGAPVVETRHALVTEEVGSCNRCFCALFYPLICFPSLLHVDNPPYP